MPNKIYTNPETSVTWADSGGDNTITLSSLAADAVRQGARHDLGASARADRFRILVNIDGFTSSPTVGRTVDLYFAFSDGTYNDGDLGTTDAASSTVVLPNLLFVGQLTVQTTTAADELTRTFDGVHFTSRYITPVVHNNSTVALAGSSTEHKIIVTPVPPEVQ